MDKVTSAIDLKVGATALVTYNLVAKDATLTIGVGCSITRVIVSAIGAGDSVAIVAVLTIGVGSLIVEDAISTIDSRSLVIKPFALAALVAKPPVLVVYLKIFIYHIKNLKMFYM